MKLTWRQTMLVTSLTVLCLVLLYLRWGASKELLLLIPITLCLVAIFFLDAYQGIIPDAISIPASILAVALAVLRGADPSRIGLGVLIGGGFFLAQYLISRGRWIGGGDIRLGVLMGILLGFPMTCVAFMIAYVTGACVGCVLLMTKQKALSSQIPFGTFLTAATFVCMLYGEHIVNIYVNMVRF